ncbi:MAG TPA: Ig-like domain-containing protein, partial [Gaiellaceae bacterium]|nr:Ig-like domain-containing protein [Gaiellaceae bacterium]
ALVAFVVVLVLAPHAAAAAPKPVPSLTPAATWKLWHQLVAKHQRFGRRATSDCRPARVVIYAATDWLRLATKLAQHASPCASYYISIPPLTANKTQARSGQASLIRALGPNMHAAAEINYAAWQKWVAAGNGDWFAAGIAARQSMAGAGYDVSTGDTWALNEVPSSVRRNTGTARSDLAQFLNGLHDGGGSPVQGIVFVIGVGQPGDQTTYKVTMQGWLQDTTFWSAIAPDVTDWMQETYGDIRNYAVAGASAQQRRDALVQYLGAPLALSTAGSTLTTAAHTFLAADYGPVANSAWAYAQSYGFTQVGFAQMEDYVSAQVYAARAFDSASGLPSDRFGFGWAPANTLGLTKGDFDAQSAAILDRLGQAISDSAVTVDPLDPGVGACGPPGQNLWCSTVVPGAAFTNSWASFSTWTQTGVTFTTPPVTVTAGAVAGPITVQLSTSGVATNAMQPTTVTLSTTSATGQFSTSSAGPWTHTLALTIPAGTAAASFYYEDTVAGTPTISATLAGQPPATQTVTVAAASPAAIAITPRSATVVGGKTQLFAARVTDQYGNPTNAAVKWTIASPKLGTLSPSVGPSTTLTASGSAAGRGTLTATLGSLSASTSVTVKRPPARIAGVTTRRVKGRLVVTVRVLQGTKPARSVPVSLVVRRGSSLVARVTGKTDKNGRFVWHSKQPLPAAHYAAKAALRSRSTS